MTAPVDTRESVEELADDLEWQAKKADRSYPEVFSVSSITAKEAAAMLRRLLERTEKAEAARAEAMAAGALAMREVAATAALVATACPGQRNAKDQWRESIGESIATAIRALPLPPDAHAAIERVREEEREACVFIVDSTPTTDQRAAREVMQRIRARGGKP